MDVPNQPTMDVIYGCPELIKAMDVIYGCPELIKAGVWAPPFGVFQAVGVYATFVWSSVW
jgi:hypothetical protein